MAGPLDLTTTTDQGRCVYLITFCLRFPGLTLLAALAIAALGVFATITARYDVFPEFAPPTVTIDTSVSGLAAEQIEGLVTSPVEDAVNGIPGLVTLRSQTSTGLSVVNAVFDGGTDIFRDRQLVAERLAPLAGSLPDGATPTIAPLRSSTGDVLSVGLSSPTLSLMELTEIARWTMRPALLSVPGVADVTIFGARPEQLQVQFDPDRMIAGGDRPRSAYERGAAGERHLRHRDGRDPESAGGRPGIRPDPDTTRPGR